MHGLYEYQKSLFLYSVCHAMTYITFPLCSYIECLFIILIMKFNENQYLRCENPFYLWQIKGMESCEIRLEQVLVLSLQLNHQYVQFQ